jgi:hypothetical protein
MEMRRKAAPRGSVDWFILSAYWLISRYALRAWRAFAALALLIVVTGIGFVWFGFDESARETTIRQIDLPSGDLIYNEAKPDYQLWDGSETARGSSIDRVGAGDGDRAALRRSVAAGARIARVEGQSQAIGTK